MRCLCGRYLPPYWSGLCTTCEMNEQGSILPPIGEIAQLIEQTSLEDFALFMIALNRKHQAIPVDRGKE
jgi:hypothetical protein